MIEDRQVAREKLLEIQLDLGIPDGWKNHQPSLLFCLGACDGGWGWGRGGGGCMYRELTGNVPFNAKHVAFASTGMSLNLGSVTFWLCDLG